MLKVHQSPCTEEIGRVPRLQRVVNEARNAPVVLDTAPHPCGALLLVSDQPMIPEGVKTEASDAKVSAEFVQNHIKVGIEALKLIRRNGKSVRHLRFDE